MLCAPVRDELLFQSSDQPSKRVGVERLTRGHQRLNLARVVHDPLVCAVASHCGIFRVDLSATEPVPPVHRRLGRPIPT